MSDASAYCAVHGFEPLPCRTCDREAPRPPAAPSPETKCRICGNVQSQHFNIGHCPIFKGEEPPRGAAAGEADRLARRIIEAVLEEREKREKLVEALRAHEGDDMWDDDDAVALAPFQPTEAK